MYFMVLIHNLAAPLLCEEKVKGAKIEFIYHKRDHSSNRGVTCQSQIV